MFSAFIKLHVLYHASIQAVFGLWLIEELAEHGYRVSPGTLYPLLHTLERAGTLKSFSEVSDGKIRRYYRITAKGRRYLDRARIYLMELVGEILAPEDIQRFTAMLLARGASNRAHQT
jgi:DNA-binding PadR family transcriptional regulator